MKNDNPVCIRAGGHVIHTPDIGSLGECLLVDQHPVTDEPCIYSRNDHILFQLESSAFSPLPLRMQHILRVW